MKRVRYLLIILIVFHSTSCKKNFLDVPDKTVLLREAYVTDLKTLGDYLNGIYVVFSRFTLVGITQIYPEVIADNIQNNSFSLMTAQYNWTQKANDQQVNSFGYYDENANGLWNSAYQIIRSCSFIIENVDKYRSENTAKADNYKGQAYAFRAFAHFLLANVFAQPYSFTPGGSHAGIPYVTTFDHRVPVTRQPVSEVYANLISDLNKAIQLLPAGSIDKRYMNQAAAKALLARVYLFKSDFRLAKDLAREVGVSFPLMTAPNYPSKLFTNQETEALFQLQPSQPNKTGSAGDYYTAFQGQWFADPALAFNATNDIATILTEYPQDLRKVWVAQSGTLWNIKKFPANLVAGFDLPAGAYYETIFRSSEMCLTAAESYANLNNEDSARHYLNQIRVRSDLPPIAVSVTGPALLDSIYKERRRELAFEGLRMYDLLRWKKGVNRTNSLNPAAQNLPYPNDKAISPIPIQDVNLSGLAQNPGY